MTIECTQVEDITLNCFKKRYYFPLKLLFIIIKMNIFIKNIIFIIIKMTNPKIFFLSYYVAVHGGKSLHISKIGITLNRFLLQENGNGRVAALTWFEFCQLCPEANDFFGS